MFYTELGITKLYNLMSNEIQTTADNLTAAQWNLLYWHRRLAHIGIDKIKDLSRLGFLPKDIAIAKSPLYIHYI